MIPWRISRKEKDTQYIYQHGYSYFFKEKSSEEDCRFFPLFLLCRFCYFLLNFQFLCYLSLLENYNEWTDRLQCLIQGHFIMNMSVNWLLWQIMAIMGVVMSFDGTHMRWKNKGKGRYGHLYCFRTWTIYLFFIFLVPSQPQQIVLCLCSEIGYTMRRNKKIWALHSHCCCGRRRNPVIQEEEINIIYV